MKIVALDIECTQPLNSTIEIGAVHYDLKKQVVLDQFSEIANPHGLHPDDLPSDEIVALTGITRDDVLAASPLRDVLTRYWDWFAAKKVGKRIHIWGTGDVWLLKQQSVKLGVPHPDVRHVNVKDMTCFVKQVWGDSYKGGLQAQLQYFGLTFQGRPHRALPDSLNTARIAAYLYRLVASLQILRKTLRECSEHLNVR